MSEELDQTIHGRTRSFHMRTKVVVAGAGYFFCFIVLACTIFPAVHQRMMLEEGTSPQTEPGGTSEDLANGSQEQIAPATPPNNMEGPENSVGLKEGNCSKVTPSTEPTNDSLSWWGYFGTNGYDAANCVISCAEGGYLVGGETTLSSGARVMYLVRIDSEGRRIWERTYRGPCDGGLRHWGAISDICEAPDGYLLAGYYRCENTSGWYTMKMLFLKVDFGGNFIWERYYDAMVERGDGQIFHPYVRAIAQCDDGGFMLTGSHLFKIDSEGNIVWEKDYGGGADIARSPDNGFVIASKTVTKVDSNGGVVWNKTLLTEQGSRITAIAASHDGGYAVAGSVECGLYIAKLDSDGILMWERIYGGKYGDSAESLVAGEDGGFVAAGLSCSYGPRAGTYYTDVYVIKVDNEGEFVWHRVYGGNDADEASDIVFFDGGYVVVGVANFADKDGDAYVLRIEDA